LASGESLMPESPSIDTQAKKMIGQAETARTMARFAAYDGFTFCALTLELSGRC